jgi:hypothetical protein
MRGKGRIGGDEGSPGRADLRARAAAVAPALPVWPLAAETKARARPTFRLADPDPLRARGEMAPPTDFKLKPHAKIAKPEGPVLVCIVDGWVSACREESLRRHTRRRARPRPKPPRRRRRRPPRPARRSRLRISRSTRRRRPLGLLHTAALDTLRYQPYKPTHLTLKPSTPTPRARTSPRTSGTPSTRPRRPRPTRCARARPPAGARSPRMAPRSACRRMTTWATRRSATTRSGLGRCAGEERAGRVGRERICCASTSECRLPQAPVVNPHLRLIMLYYIQLYNPS